MNHPLVSVIIPCRNEARFIERCLASITSTSYPPDRLEILVTDGMSEDGTRRLIAIAAKSDPRIMLIDNPAHTAPAAMNLAIARARGAVIMRMDAHCEYPKDYIPTLVAALESSGASNVGGVWETLPAGDSAVAKGIALALAHPAGVGNSHFRIGTREPLWVDTVPFGCWHRELFSRIGMFDESLVRNQDDEHNMRIRRAGGRILLLPDVITRYYARETLGQLWRMNAQYGYYKPLAARRSGSRLRPRQLAPAALVLALGGGMILAPFTGAGVALFAATAAAYALFVLAAAIPIAIRRGPAIGAAFAVAIPTMHLAYGYGFLRGAVRFAILRRDSAAAAPAPSR